MASTALDDPFAIAGLDRHNRQVKYWSDKITGGDLHKMRVSQTEKLLTTLEERVDAGEIDFPAILFELSLRGDDEERIGGVLRKLYAWADCTQRDVLLELLTNFWGHDAGRDMDLLRQMRSRKDASWRDFIDWLTPNPKYAPKSPRRPFLERPEDPEAYNRFLDRTVGLEDQIEKRRKERING